MEFDVDVALEQAMRLFWLKGYLGTSVSDLTSAMGINRESFYAAFGSKNDLFCKVLDRYGQGPSAYALTAFGRGMRSVPRFSAPRTVRMRRGTRWEREVPITTGCGSVGGA